MFSNPVYNLSSQFNENSLTQNLGNLSINPGQIRPSQPNFNHGILQQQQRLAGARGHVQSSTSETNIRWGAPDDASATYQRGSTVVRQYNNSMIDDYYKKFVRPITDYVPIPANGQPTYVYQNLGGESAAAAPVTTSQPPAVEGETSNNAQANVSAGDVSQSNTESTTKEKKHKKKHKKHESKHSHSEKSSDEKRTKERAPPVLQETTLTSIAAAPQNAVNQQQVTAAPSTILAPVATNQPRMAAPPTMIPPASISQPRTVAQPIMAQQPRMVAPPIMAQQPRIVAPPTMAQQPRMAAPPTMAQQPRMAAPPTMAQQPKMAAPPTMAQQPRMVAPPTIPAASAINQQQQPSTAASIPDNQAGGIGPKAPMKVISNPVVFFDIEIDGELRGRLVMELFRHALPRTAQNFLSLTLNEHGFGYRLSYFHRIIPGFMAQAGDFEKSDGTGGRSIYGEKFDDEGFPFPHDRAGLLSMANSGPNTNGSQFFITLAPAPHLNGKHVVFGQVLQGFHILQDFEMSGSESGEILREVKIASTGQLQ